MPQSSARSFMVILLSGLVRSTFFSDASSARLVICDMSAPCCAAFSRIFCCCGVFAWLTAVQGKAMQRRVVDFGLLTADFFKHFGGVCIACVACDFEVSFCFVQVFSNAAPVFVYNAEIIVCVDTSQFCRFR